MCCRSTTVGSITLAPKYTVFNTPAYKVSKAALNMLAVQYALYFKDDGFMVVSISPGVSVYTDYLRLKLTTGYTVATY